MAEELLPSLIPYFGCVMPWGLRQFHVLDLEDNQITFGQTFE
jgi:hypothetical protein